MKPKWLKLSLVNEFVTLLDRRGLKLFSSQRSVFFFRPNEHADAENAIGLEYSWNRKKPNQLIYNQECGRQRKCCHAPTCRAAH